MVEVSETTRTFISKVNKTIRQLKERTIDDEYGLNTITESALDYSRTSDDWKERYLVGEYLLSFIYRLVRDRRSREMPVDSSLYKTSAQKIHFSLGGDCDYVASIKSTAKSPEEQFESLLGSLDYQRVLDELEKL